MLFSLQQWKISQTDTIKLVQIHSTLMNWFREKHNSQKSWNSVWNLPQSSSYLKIGNFWPWVFFKFALQLLYFNKKVVEKDQIQNLVFSEAKLRIFFERGLCCCPVHHCVYEELFFHHCEWFFFYRLKNIFPVFKIPSHFTHSFLSCALCN